MKISTLIQNINSQLAGELLSVAELRCHIDAAIDDINTQLNTVFPVLSDIDLTVGEPEYTAIPDKYIRSVVIPGAAFKFYTTDEEGAAVAPKYEETYRMGLFYMMRDYLSQVPEEYQAETTGYAVHEENYLNAGGGLSIDGSVFNV